MIVAIATTCGARACAGRAPTTGARSRIPSVATSATVRRGHGPAGCRVGDDASAAQLDDAIGDPRDLAVVRDDEHGAPGFGLRLQQRQDLDPGVEVELAGRFVGEEHRVPGGERPGDRDALLLAARELVRVVVHTRPRARRLRAPAALAARRRGESAISAPKRTFSSAVSSGKRLNAWNTKLTVLRRYSNCSARRRARQHPVRRPRSRPRSACRARRSCSSSVVLPLPDGPSTTTQLARVDRQRRRLERDDRPGDRLESLRDLSQLDQGHGVLPVDSSARPARAIAGSSIMHRLGQTRQSHPAGARVTKDHGSDDGPSEMGLTPLVVPVAVGHRWVQEVTRWTGSGRCKVGRCSGTDADAGRRARRAARRRGRRRRRGARPAARWGTGRVRGGRDARRPTRRDPGAQGRAPGPARARDGRDRRGRRAGRERRRGAHRERELGDVRRGRGSASARAARGAPSDSGVPGCACRSPAGPR